MGPKVTARVSICGRLFQSLGSSLLSGLHAEEMDKAFRVD